MPNPSRPSNKPAWTQGNPSQQTQPTSSEKLGGYSPNQRPAPKKFNWILGNVSDWIDWFDFWGTSGQMPVSNVGHNIILGTTLQDQLDELDAFISSLGMQPITLTATADPHVYTCNPTPLNTAPPIVFLDGLGEKPTTDFTYAVVGGVGQVSFVVVPSAGQTPFAMGITANNPGVGGTAMSGGFVVYGASGGGVVVTATVGVIPTTDQRALIFVTSTGGAAPVSANPQIAPGTKIGQELRLVGTSNTDYISLADGNGLSLNGLILLKNKVSIDLWWDGSVWNENDRK